MNIVEQAKQDLLNIVLADGTDVLKPNNTTVKAIFRESSENKNFFEDEIVGTEIFIIGSRDDLLDIKTDDILVIGTRAFKVVSKEKDDFKIKLMLEEL